MVIAVAGMIAGIMFLVQMVLYEKLWNRSVEVRIRFRDDSVSTGHETVLSEVVENRKWLPLPALKVKFQCSGELKFVDDGSSKVTDMYYRNDLFCMMPFRRITRSHKICCSKRGYYGIRGIDLVGADLFMTREMVESRTGEAHIYVIPALYETEELKSAVQIISGEALSKRHLITDPFAYRGIREYTPFDEAKTVNWKASAKADELKVNVYDHTSVSTVEIYINLADRQIVRQEERNERAISIGAYLTKVFLEAGIGVSLYANGKDIIHKNILCMEENHDKGQLEHIYKMLARIDLSLGTEAFVPCFEERLMKDTGQMTVFISPDCQPEYQDLLCRLEKNRQFLWICPGAETEEADIRNELLSCVLSIPMMMQSRLL